MSGELVKLNEYLQSNATLVDEYLSRKLRFPSAPSSLEEAMRYGSIGGGKKVRASLLFAAGEGFSLDPESLLPLAGGIEMIHSFSLVHDDLPCMDDDDYRRGKPSLHRAFGESMGVLAGDAMLIEGFRFFLSDTVFLSKFGEKTVLSLTNTLLDALGTEGMVGGQVLDLEAEEKTVSRDTVHRIMRMKTAALIRACVVCGALAGRGDEEELMLLSEFGRLLGECFQLKDDILDLTASSHILGKTAGKDVAQEKATLIRIEGMEEARNALSSTFQKALSYLGRIERSFPRLRELSCFIVERKK